MRKESLQEATQRVLIEGYKNLKENKSKKVEVTEGNQEWYYYEVHFDFTEESGKDSDGYSKFFKSSKDVEDDTEYITNLAIEENILDEDDLADIDYIDYAQKIDKEEYERATRTKTENKITEAYNYDWRDDIEEVGMEEKNDDLVYAFAENLIETDPDYADYDDPWEIISDIISIWKINKRSRLYDYLIKWYGSEEEMKKHIRSFYETNNAIYFETGVGYSIFDADLLGGNANGETARAFDTFVANGGVKEESKEVILDDVEDTFNNLPDNIKNYLKNTDNVPTKEIEGTLWFDITQEEKEQLEQFINYIDTISEDIWRKWDEKTKLDISSYVNNANRICRNCTLKLESKKVEEAKLNFINNVDELPDMCYGLLPSDKSIIIIKKGENGYYETDLGSPENAEEVVNDLNERMGVTPDQRFTMEIRSINNNWEDTKTESKKLKESYNVYTTDYNEDGTITKEFYMSFDTYKEAEIARQGLQDEGMDAWIEELNESKKVTRHNKRRN